MAAEFQVDPRARHHLVLSDRRGWPVARKLLDELAARGASRQYLRDTGVRRDHEFAAMLAEQVMGTHLYVAGIAPWVAWVQRIAEGEGLLPSEVDAIRIGSPASYVFCIACYQRFPHPQQQTVVCPNCGAALSVTDHMSGRLDAVMGSLQLPELEGDQTDG